VIIRPAHPDDAPALIRIDRAVVSAGAGTVRDMGDVCDDPAEVCARIKKYHPAGDTSGDAGVFLVAEIDGRVVGQATCFRLQFARIQHVASLALQVHPDVQGRGVGRSLWNGLLNWATAPDRSALIRLQLVIRADNVRAIRLYESTGFRIESRRRAMIREKSGTLLDDLVMVRLLSNPLSASDFGRDAGIAHASRASKPQG